MEKPAAHAEMLFARALELPRGPAREEFLAKECAATPALLQEVQSLLRAHEQAGDFLESPRVGHSGISLPPPAPPASAMADAAARAQTFVCSGLPAGRLEEYLASVPADVRQETRERIEAALHLRSFVPASQPALTLSPEPPRFPGYRISHRLGAGSLGVVYAAEDEKLNRPVALKVLHLQPDVSVRRRLLEEARKAAALSDPAIVTVFAVLDDAEPPALVMERVEGFPLDRFAAQLNVEQKARLLREVARALAVAHERGVLHRDLKPDNIIVGPDMRPRLLDFGLALSLQEGARQGRGFEGTPLYASPEQVRGQALGAASDVFSFGSLMFKVLTGRPPFAGESVAQVLQAIATTAPPMLRELAVGVPEDLQAICLACLAWNPAERPTAADVALELGRFLAGEPVRLRPKLYGDLLRRSISEYANQARNWESQSVISREERDALEVVHRRLLADEDHWIIDARRITLLQTLLSGGTWLTVVATLLTVWLLREELGTPWRWLLPAGFTLTLLGAGVLARRQREELASATFLAGAALAIAPCTLSLLSELRVFSNVPNGVTQLFHPVFTNQQVLAASLTALALSGLAWARLKMTGFAWTTASLSVITYLSGLLLLNWLEFKPENRAFWCLPLACMESAALILERRGRVRWTLPFHLVALLALVGSLDVIALNGPTLQMLGINAQRWAYFDGGRLQTLSVAANGLLFLALAVLTQRAASLDLRRGSKLLEILAILHLLSALFTNALNHRGAPYVRLDVWLYLGAALLFLVLAPFRSRWRMLVGGLAGCGLGCYLLVALGLVDRRPFVVGLGCLGLLIALGTFVYVRNLPRLQGPLRRVSSAWLSQTKADRSTNNPPAGA